VQFVEGSVQEVDRYCALLQPRLGVQRETCSAVGSPLSAELRDEIDGLRDMEPHYRVWGGYEGRGLVIRSEEPVDFHPDGRVVNVVPVASLDEAVQRANVATHILNGRLMSVTIDDDAPNRKLDGLIGMQVHTGPPMKIEYRNIRLKRW